MSCQLALGCWHSAHVKLLQLYLPCRYKLGDRPPLPSGMFQKHWDYHCRSAWHQAIYMFTAGECIFVIPRLRQAAFMLSFSNTIRTP